MIRNLGELYRYRALLWSLTQRELKARYRGSILGFLWTFLNPTLQMAVYALVFGVILQQTVPHYPYFMFVGLLPWICFSTSITAGASAISDRRDLLTKVRFPAQVLPATVIATQVVNLLLSLPLMVVFGILLGVPLTWHAAFFPVVLLVQILFTSALVFVASALNVAFRDLQHILTNIITLWFFAAPVVYTFDQVPARFRPLYLYADPLAVIIRAYQQIFYEHVVPEFQPLVAVAVGSLVLLWGAMWIFEWRREEFAEVA